MQVDREEFLAALAKIKPALGRGGSIPQLSHLWFDGKTASAFDGGFGVRISLKSELEGGVPGAQLLGLLETSKLKEIDVEPNGSGLSVKMGRSSSKLVTLEADQNVWPYPAKLPKGSVTLELNEAFVEGLKRTLFVKASPATRVEHHGVLLVAAGDEDGVVLYSTDSATLVAVSLGDVEAEAFKVLLPHPFAAQVVAQGGELLKLTVAKDCLIADLGGVVLYSNLLDLSETEDLGALLERSLAKHPKPVALPEGFEAALVRAAVLAGSKDAEITASVEKDTLFLSGEYTYGALAEKLPLEGKIPNGSLRLHADMIRRALPYADKFSLTEQSLVLHGPDGFTYVVAGL